MEKLMKNAGVVFSEEAVKQQNSEGIDDKQRFLLKTKVIPDFRRQTTPKTHTNIDFSLESCKGKY